MDPLPGGPPAELPDCASAVDDLSALHTILEKVDDSKLRDELAHTLLRWRDSSLRRQTLLLAPRERKRIREDESPVNARGRFAHDTSYDNDSDSDDDDDLVDRVWLVSGDGVSVRLPLDEACSASGFLNGVHEHGIPSSQHVQLPEWLHSRVLKTVCRFIRVLGPDAETRAEVAAESLLQYVRLVSTDGRPIELGASNEEQLHALSELLELVRAASFLDVAPLLELSSQAVYAWLVRRGCPFHELCEVLSTHLPQRLSAEKLAAMIDRSLEISSPWKFELTERERELFNSAGCADALWAGLETINDDYVSSREGVGLAGLALCSLELRRQLDAHVPWGTLLCPQLAIEGEYECTEDVWKSFHECDKCLGRIFIKKPPLDTSDSVDTCSIRVFRRTCRPNRFTILSSNCACTNQLNGDLQGRKLILDDVENGNGLVQANGDIQFGDGRTWTRSRMGGSALSALIDASEDSLPVSGSTWLKKIVHPTSGEVAMARRKPPSEMQGINALLMREVSSLRMLCHPNVVDLYACEPRSGSLVYELLPYDVRSLVIRLKLKRSRISLPSMRSILNQTLRAVDHLHSRGVLHRRVKTSSMRFDLPSGRCKLTNFEYSRVLVTPGGEDDMRCLTLEGNWWTGKAPEMVLARAGPDFLTQGKWMPARLPYSFPIDLWAVGCMLLEMSAGGAPFLYPFNGTEELHYLYNIFHLLGTPTEQTWHGWSRTYVGGISAKGEEYVGPLFPPKELSTAAPGLSPVALDLLSKLLALDPLRRISARDALNHEFFADEPPISSMLPEMALLDPNAATESDDLLAAESDSDWEDDLDDEIDIEGD